MYVESDPIGLHGGSYSTYSYAGGNPVSSVDSKGLVIWNGGYIHTSGGISNFGGGVASAGYTFVLKSDCVNGKRTIVVVDALATTAGIGISFLGPVSLGASTVTFNDNLSTLDPNIFNGDFSTFNVGTLLASATGFVMGGAVGDGGGWNVSTSAFDISGGNGKSHLRRPPRIENCGCDSNK